MQIPDCLSQMSKSYLSRIVDSIYKEDIPKNDEEQMKEQIRQNTDYLANPERIREALNLKEMDRTNRILVVAILNTLLEHPDAACPEEDLYDQVTQYENWIINKAQEEGTFAYANKHAIDVYKTVLQVALENADISQDEYALLDKLREKLQISRLEHRLLEASLGMYPTPGNTPHTYDQFKDALKTLQKLGLLFYCNKASKTALVVLPDEIAPEIKTLLGFEMGRDKQEMLHDHLTTTQLRTAAKEQGIPSSGKKDEISERLIEALCKPSEILNSLSKDDLTALCKKLPGVGTSGNKEELRDRIIERFATFTPKQSPEAEQDPRATYYQYYEELAHRKNQELYPLGIIKKDGEMDTFFEEATKYLFETKLGCELIEPEGNEHADGAVAFSNGQVLLWDNKSKEQEYAFPKSHADQFLRYIRESTQRVNVFVVIVPDLAPKAEQQAMQLKYRNNTDTDVALIRARDLKFVAENWPDFAKTDQSFDLNVFNATGILERSDLEERMKMLLG